MFPWEAREDPAPLPPPQIISSPTPRPQASHQDLSKTTPYTDTDALFEVNIPATWELYAFEQKATAPTITHMTFAPRDQPDIYWLMLG